jgi:hypothetical protein
MSRTRSADPDSRLKQSAQRVTKPTVRQKSPPPMTGGWGARIVRVYKYNVLVQLTCEPKPFRVLYPYIDRVAPLRAGDELLIRIQQLPRSKTKSARKGSRR